MLGLGLIPRVALIGAGVAVVGLALNNMRVVWERNAARATLAQVQVEFAQHRATAAAAAAAAEQAHRQQETRWRAQQTEARKKHEAALQEQARVADRARVDGERLRDTIAGFAAGGEIARDTLDACNRRAATLGNLLADADRLAESLARAAEAHRDQVALLMGSWPKAE